MTKQEEKLTLEGKVVEALPNTTFRVKLENDYEVLAYLSGKMRKYYIRVLLGDRVRVELSPYDLTRAASLPTEATRPGEPRPSSAARDSRPRSACGCSGGLGLQLRVFDKARGGLTGRVIIGSQQRKP